MFSQFAPSVFDKSVKSRALLPTGRPSRGFGTPFPIPAWSFLCRRGQRLQQFFFVGGGGGGYLGFILRLDTASSIFPNIFVQDCRLSHGTNCFDYHFHYKNLPQLSQSVNVVTTWHQIEITIFLLLPKTGSLNE